MGPKKAPAKAPETEVPDVETTKKAPPKRVRKPKEEKQIKEIVISSDSNIKLNNIKKKLAEYTEKSESLNAQLEELDLVRQAILKEMTEELEANANNKLDDKNTFILDKPSTSETKTPNIKIDSSDSSNDKESSENDTNSDDDTDAKPKTTKNKSKNIKAQPAKAQPAKSRAKGKITSVPVLQHDESDSDNE
jgi:hypothetical protein